MSVKINYDTARTDLAPLDAFSPSITRAGLVEYWDAAAFRSENGGVEQWQGLLGTLATQRHPTKKPAFASPSMVFEAGEWMWTEVVMPTTGCFGVRIVAGATPTAIRPILSAADSATVRIALNHSTSGNAQFLVGSVAITASGLALTPGNTHTLIVRWTGTTAHVYRDGVQVGTGTAYSNAMPTKPIALGARMNSAGAIDSTTGTTVNLARLAIYDGAAVTIDNAFVTALHSALLA